MYNFASLFYFIWSHTIPSLHGLIIKEVDSQFSCSVVSRSLRPMDCRMRGFPVHHHFLELAQTHVQQVGDAIHFIPCWPFLLPPSVFPSIRVISNESVLRFRWVNYCSFSLSISPFNKYSGLISFRMDWLGLLAVQGTLKSLLQYHSSKASILWCSAFFTIQLSHPYMTTGKTIALTLQTFPRSSEVKASAYNAGDLGLNPQLGRYPGEGNGNPLQYSCLENPMDGGAWWATVHGVAKSQTWLGDFSSVQFSSVGKVMPLLFICCLGWS